MERGQAFGRRLFYLWWLRACHNLGVEGVDLYGGTRHSTVQALRRDGLTPEEIKRGTMHRTNKAFERYLQIEGDEVKRIYGRARQGGGKELAKVLALPEKGKALK